MDKNYILESENIKEIHVKYPEKFLIPTEGVTAMNKSYTLENVQEVHMQFPRTFIIPTEEEIEDLKIDDLVKLIFCLPEETDNDCRAERMWVQIIEISEDGFSGILDNEPYYIQNLHSGDLITFQKKHIAAIFIRGKGVIDESKFAVITLRALEHREVNWAYHTDDLCDEQDSGWILCYGGEDDSYWEDVNNTKVIFLEEVMSFEPRLLEVFTGGADAYYYDADKNKFIAEEN